MRYLLGLALACLLSYPTPANAQAQDKYQPMVDKGLTWLAKEQAADGSWSASGTTYATTMTAMAGLAFVMEGSTSSTGKYKETVRRAVNWLIARCQFGGQNDGRFGNALDPGDSARYMFAQGYTVLFLSCVLENEKDQDRRRALKDVLHRSVRFIGRAQSSKGGWYYIASFEIGGGDQDEGAATVAQVQGLRAAELAGIAIPKDVLAKACAYLKNNTSPIGGLYYSTVSKQERPALTAAALACAIGDHDRFGLPYIQKLTKYCERSIPMPPTNKGHDSYTVFYFAQAMHRIGDDGYALLFPDARPNEILRWSEIRQKLFDHLQKAQLTAGSWSLVALA